LLANSPNELNKIKTQLRKQKAQLPLFSTDQFAKDLECLFQQIWKDYTQA